MFRTIRWKLTAGSLLAVVLPLVAIAFLLGHLLWQFYLRQLEQELRSKASVVVDSAAPILSPATPDDDHALSMIVDRWRRYSSMRVTIADAHGHVRAATADGVAGTHVDERSQPGLRDALAGRPNSTVWKNPDFGYQDSMYVNLPVLEKGRVVGAVRVGYTLTQIQANLRRIREALVAATLLYALVIISLTFLLSQGIAAPIEALDRGAQRLARGELEHRLRVRGTREVVHLAETLNQMAGRLQELEGLRRQYVSDVSHELRTPLASIRTMTETMIQYGESDPGLFQRYLPRIVQQTDRLARLAAQVLDLAQIESGNILGAMTPLVPGAVLDEAVETCRSGATAAGVNLVLQAADSLPAVTADRDRLVQVIVNLVDNAVRYTPPGGTVTVDAVPRGDLLVIRIEDTGKGIPEEHLPRLFERFYRVEEDRSKRTGGTGLGLAIVRQIVEAHGGGIHVRSTVGEGTEFTIELPVSAGSELASKQLNGHAPSEAR